MPVSQGIIWHLLLAESMEEGQGKMAKKLKYEFDLTLSEEENRLVFVHDKLRPDSFISYPRRVFANDATKLAP